MDRRRTRRYSIKGWLILVRLAVCLRISGAFLPRSPCPGRNQRHQVSRKEPFVSLVSSVAGRKDQKQWNTSVSRNEHDGASSVNTADWTNGPIVAPEIDGPVLLGSISRSDKAKLIFITCSSVLMLLTLYQISGAGTWRYYLAGGMCAAISHTIPVPIDVVKTRKQVDPSLEDTSLSEALRRIIQHDGWNVLLDGLGPTIFGYMFEGAIKFGVYEVMKPIIGGFLATHSRFSSPWSAYLLCGLSAGFAASIVLCPMEAIRIRIVSERRYAVNGWVAGTRQMLRTEGTGFLSKGLAAMIFKQVPYTMTKNVSFDFFAMRFYAALVRLGTQLTPAVKICVPLLAAVCSSILSCISSQPGDMLLSAVNANGDNKGTRDAIGEILRSEKGVRGFFVGMQTRFLHVGVIVTLQLLMYDLIKRLCGIQATGL